MLFRLTCYILLLTDLVLHSMETLSQKHVCERLAEEYAECEKEMLSEGEETADIGDLVNKLVRYSFVNLSLRRYHQNLQQNEVPIFISI